MFDNHDPGDVTGLEAVFESRHFGRTAGAGGAGLAAAVRSTGLEETIFSDGVRRTAARELTVRGVSESGGRDRHAPGRCAHDASGAHDVADGLGPPDRVRGRCCVRERGAPSAVRAVAQARQQLVPHDRGRQLCGGARGRRRHVASGPEATAGASRPSVVTEPVAIRRVEIGTAPPALVRRHRTRRPRGPRRTLADQPALVPAMARRSRWRRRHRVRGSAPGGHVAVSGAATDNGTPPSSLSSPGPGGPAPSPAGFRRQHRGLLRERSSLAHSILSRRRRQRSRDNSVAQCRRAGPVTNALGAAVSGVSQAVGSTTS